MLEQITGSLRGRLALAALLVLLLFLGFTGYALDRAFQNSIEGALLERLKTQIYALLTAAEDEQGKLVMPELLQDPELNRIGSGRYGLITDGAGNEIWRSPSAVSLTLTGLQTAAAGEYSLSETDTDNERLFLFSYGVIWENQDGSESRYGFHILQSNAPIAAEISGFRSTLWRWLGGMGILLLLIQAVILRWGLAPLPRLAADLRKIEQGEREQLSGKYPKELAGVATNLNVLIANERRQRQRYRNTLADLAHSLKTPLAILRGVTPQQLNTAPDEALDTIAGQVDRMDQIVTYQLQRASSPQVSLTVKPVALEPLADKLMRTLEKVYRDKGVATEIDITSSCQFKGDERDLMEILGNLLDNAFKACRNKVALRGNRITAISGDSSLRVSIEDDGPGIPEEKRQDILLRGVRADTSQPGQGIGLAVALEIVESYRGKLEVEKSTLGGARFIIELPG